MDYTFLLEYEGMSIYECSKRSGIPYSTLADIMKGKTPIEKVSFKNAKALAETMDMSMEDLYAQMHTPKRTSFETFKSQTRHEVKMLGDVEFINVTIHSKMIEKYWHLEWFYEALYLLAMIDYLCRINKIAKAKQYDEFREYKLPEPVYPMDISIAAKLNKKLDIRREAMKESVPEFARHNIVEKDIRDVY